MTTETTITLTANTLPLFAHKRISNGEYVEVEASSPAADSYSVTRAFMGRPEWQAADLTAAEVVEACSEWGLDNWTPTLYGEN